VEEAKEVVLMPTLQPVISACHVFKPDSESVERTTIVVAPITFKEVKGKSVVSWSCSHGRTCHNSSCIYARGGENIEERE